MIFAALLCALLLNAPPISADPAPSTSRDRPLPLRLMRPNERPLGGADIIALISNHSLIVDNDYEPAPGIKIFQFYFGGCPPYETFFSDGSWEMGMCQRAYRVYEGRWTIEPFSGAERLCVEAPDYPKACRLSWRGPTDDRLIMQFLTIGGTDNIHAELHAETFSLYRAGPPRGGRVQEHLQRLLRKQPAEHIPSAGPEN